MRKQIPPGFFTLAVLGALFVAFLVITFGAKNVSDAPDFEATTLDGAPIRLSALKGKVVLINFWATWCGPCAEEIPELIALQKQFEAKGFTVIGVSSDDAPETARAFAKQMNIPYPIVMRTDTIARDYGGIPALPTTFIVNKEGKVVLKQEGYGQGVVEGFKRAIEESL